LQAWKRIGDGKRKIQFFRKFGNEKKRKEKIEKCKRISIWREAVTDRCREIDKREVRGEDG
tara:strand:- start:110 stop:292 length:183 start_codon:yes stop_codon:yes gene_type:complete